MSAVSSVSCVLGQLHRVSAVSGALFLAAERAWTSVGSIAVDPRQG